MGLCRTLLALLLSGAALAQQAAPYTVADGVFNPAKPDLGLRRAPGTQTFTVFAPDANSDKFSNGVVLIPFQGRLYAQWQSSPRDEDSGDTWVAYSVSDDGEHWSPPRMLAGAGSGTVMHSNGGWWTDGKTLIAYLNVWPMGFQSGMGGFTNYLQSSDGEHWSEPRRVTGKFMPVDGVIEQDPHALANGRIVAAFHLMPGTRVRPFYTDDPLGVGGWMPAAFTNLPHEGKESREFEPSLFARADCLVMVFRDQSSTYRQLASQSCDAGQSWSTPALTNMPDARAKQSAGNLPDGTAYLVNAPNTDKLRIPLAVTLSRDGRIFDRAFLLRGAADLQPLRFAGQFKRPGYHYPKSVVWGGYLYAGYAANKEDVQLTRVPLASLSGSAAAASPARSTPAPR